MKNGDILNTVIDNQSLPSNYQRAMGVIASMKLGGKLTNTIYKNEKIVVEGGKTFDGAKKSLQEQYALKEDDGSIKKIEGTNHIDFGENLPKFQEEWNKLLDCEIDINKIDLEPLLEQFSDLTLEQTNALYLLLT